MSSRLKSSYLLERGGGRGIENMGHLATNVGSEICNWIEEVNNNYIFNGSIYHKDGLQIVLHYHRTNIFSTITNLTINKLLLSK